MTNTAELSFLSLQEEEQFLYDKLQSAKEALELHKAETSKRRFIQNTLEKQLEDIKQAVTDYMVGNGLMETEKFLINTTHIVDVENIDAVPDEYVRTKITKEPNKILIKEKKPEGNWYTIKENVHVKLKGEQ